ncbi:c-type cytochrome [Halovulum dunhuangense]|uniref:C-type cytochrome n=1 Tax=Halovulum dunhuangense TaxID=1505036 RepID=A0A849KVF8_9RHOB|nr:c-type cytochrome [Halovulum dunhuangense]NNU79378.1 c-type cytochrome [Halovulum dunhuangense]
MKYSLTIAAAAVLAAGTAFAGEHASGDAAAGESVFNQCSTCHQIADGDNVLAGRGRNGPNLYGLFGRQAGTADFNGYGDSLVALGEAGLEWNQEDFVAYVQDPRSFLQEKLDDRGARTRMSYRLRGEDDARNVWAYIVSLGPAPAN